MTPTEAAYLAGLIDGEGSIGLFINKARSRPNSDTGGGAAVARMKIGMCDAPLVHWLHKMTGSGNVTSWEHHDGICKPCYVVTWHGRAAADIIPQVWPYLRLKRPQAKILMQWIRISKSQQGKLGGRGHHERKYPAHIWRKAEQLGAAIRVLNRKGLRVKKD